MWVLFNSEGNITTAINHGQTIKQGNSFDMYICFENENENLDISPIVQFIVNGSLTGDGVISRPDCWGKRIMFECTRTGEYTGDFVQGKTYIGYHFTVAAGSTVTNQYGSIDFVISNASGVGISLGGKGTVNILKTFGNADVPTITGSEYTTLVSMIQKYTTMTPIAIDCVENVSIFPDNYGNVAYSWFGLGFICGKIVYTDTNSTDNDNSKTVFKTISKITDPLVFLSSPSYLHGIVIGHYEPSTGAVSTNKVTYPRIGSDVELRIDYSDDLSLTITKSEDKKTVKRLKPNSSDNSKVEFVDVDIYTYTFTQNGNSVPVEMSEEEFDNSYSDSLIYDDSAKVYKTNGIKIMVNTSSVSQYDVISFSGMCGLDASLKMPNYDDSSTSVRETTLSTDDYNKLLTAMQNYIGGSSSGATAAVSSWKLASTVTVSTSEASYDIIYNQDNFSGYSLTDTPAENDYVMDSGNRLYTITGVSTNTSEGVTVTTVTINTAAVNVSSDDVISDSTSYTGTFARASWVRAIVNSLDSHLHSSIDNAVSELKEGVEGGTVIAAKATDATNAENLNDKPAIEEGTYDSETGITPITVTAGNQKSEEFIVPYAKKASDAINATNAENLNDAPSINIGEDGKSINVTAGNQTSNDIVVPFASKSEESEKSEKAEKAEKDDDGNVISSTYEKVDDLELNYATKAYIIDYYKNETAAISNNSSNIAAAQTSIQNITSGATVVGKATQATNDGNGNKIDVNKYFATIETNYVASTGIITLTFKNQTGTVLATKTIDTPIESLFQDVKYDSTTKEITFIFNGGSTTSINVKDLVDTYKGGTTSTITVAVGGNSITANLNDKSVLESHMGDWFNEKVGDIIENEATRVESEKTRVANETARQNAETAREAEFESLKTNFVGMGLLTAEVSKDPDFDNNGVIILTYNPELVDVSYGEDTNSDGVYEPTDGILYLEY